MPEPRRHIALVHRDLHSVTRGGICRLYRSLAGALAARGHHVTLLGQDSPHPLPARSPVAGGGTVCVRTVLARGYGSADRTAHRQAVTAALAELAPDIAECSSWEYELLDYLDHPGRAPVVVRGDLSAATMDAAELIDGERRIVTAGDALLAVSGFAARDLAAAYGRSARTVPNGVDTGLFRPAAAGGLPCSGQLVRLNRTGAAAARSPLTAALDDAGSGAARFFSPDGPRRPRLLWVGKATKMKGWDRLEELAPALGGSADLLVVLGHGQVHFPVTLDRLAHVTVVQDLDDRDLPAVYGAADWALSTSRWEGFGLAVAEAMACGVPALLPADLGVAPELLAAGGGTTYNTAADLLAALSAGWPPAPPAGWLPAAFSWPANAATTAAVYEQLLAEASSCAS